ncbi:MAG: DNA polymerase III subunit gamma/tau [Cetobacterium sp.]|uniref:DNA polymerase III subunit gamma/tau n=1 Tax=Cetobacterium sp. TaxID=2071632 RepID=UPI002FC9B672
MHITLYRKYRPKDFSEVAGEDEIVTTLKNSLRTGRIAHAYLFNGPRGVGKTTVARLIAKGVNCLENGITDTPCNKCENCLSITEGNFMDLIEIDAASNRGIDEIRQLKEKINYRPSKGRKKIYIIDEVHMLTKEAFNALLKTLEEPPEHAIFILATTEPDKILPTIISRCQRYDFKTLNYKSMKEKLLYIAREENITIDDGSLALIYESSTGSMRDAISILERVMITCLQEAITIEKTEEVLGITSTVKIKKFIEIIKNSDTKEAVVFLDELWQESINIELFFKDLAKYSKDLILKNEIELELGLNIIDVIYETLNRFKFEEDKRLVGYVIVNILLKKSEKIVSVERVIEKFEVQEEIIIDVSIDEIRKQWPMILTAAKKQKITLGAFLIGANPVRIKGNTLYIGFDQENSFAKEQMESEIYNSIFTEVIRKITDSNIQVKYEVAGRKKENKAIENDLSKKIMDFFGGEVIS